MNNPPVSFSTRCCSNPPHHREDPASFVPISCASPTVIVISTLSALTSDDDDDACHEEARRTWWKDPTPSSTFQLWSRLHREAGPRWHGRELVDVAIAAALLRRGCWTFLEGSVNVPEEFLKVSWIVCVKFVSTSRDKFRCEKCHPSAPVGPPQFNPLTCPTVFSRTWEKLWRRLNCISLTCLTSVC